MRHAPVARTRIRSSWPVSGVTLSMRLERSVARGSLARPYAETSASTASMTWVDGGGTSAVGIGGSIPAPRRIVRGDDGSEWGRCASAGRPRSLDCARKLGVVGMTGGYGRLAALWMTGDVLPFTVLATMRAPDGRPLGDELGPR